MNAYYINFYDINGKHQERCRFYVDEDETFHDKLEEVLYIMKEITPNHRYWMCDLGDEDKCLFNYHGVQTVQVEWEKGSHLIRVKDI